tara:strand:- start:66 stop:371 length:306 start_codon:yes stop_codon:yes gene_type:complete
MINKTSKQTALNLINKALVRLDNETFLQFNMVGIDWLFITTNDERYVNITTDRVGSQFTVSVLNKYAGYEQKEYYNVTRPTMQAIDDLLSSKQNVYLLERD